MSLPAPAGPSGTGEALGAESLSGWLDALGSDRPTPAGGSLALVTLAGCAALARKVARGRAPAPPLEPSTFLTASAEDAAAYGQALSGGDPARRACLAAGLRHLDAALLLLDSLATLFEGLPDGLAADVAAANRLARASARTLLVNLAVNASEWEGLGGLEEFRARLERARARLGEA